MDFHKLVSPKGMFYWIVSWTKINVYIKRLKSPIENACLPKGIQVSNTYPSTVSSLINFWVDRLSQKLALLKARWCWVLSDLYPGIGYQIYLQTKHLNADQQLLCRCSAFSPQQCQKLHHVVAKKMPKISQELPPLDSWK